MTTFLHLSLIQESDGKFYSHFVNFLPNTQLVHAKHHLFFLWSCRRKNYTALTHSTPLNLNGSISPKNLAVANALAINIDESIYILDGKDDKQNPSVVSCI